MTSLFAYGTLMAKEALREALGERADAFVLRPARLSGWRRIWNVYRQDWNGGVLNVEPCDDAVVVGILVEGLRPADFEILDAQEFTHLPRETLLVQPLGTETAVPAEVYRRRQGNHHGRPAGRYRAVVLDRAYHAGWEVYESVCRGSVDATGNPLRFG